MGDHSKWFGGAHALDGMVILLLSLGLAVAAWRSRPGGVRQRPGASPATQKRILITVRNARAS